MLQSIPGLFFFFFSFWGGGCICLFNVTQGLHAGPFHCLTRCLLSLFLNFLSTFLPPYLCLCPLIQVFYHAGLRVLLFSSAEHQRVSFNSALSKPIKSNICPLCFLFKEEISQILGECHMPRFSIKTSMLGKTLQFGPPAEMIKLNNSYLSNWWFTNSYSTSNYKSHLNRVFEDSMTRKLIPIQKV